MNKFMHAALAGAALSIFGFGGAAQAATTIPFTFTGGDSYETIQGSGSFTLRVDSGAALLSDVSGFVLNGSSDGGFGFVTGSYSFSGPGDLTAFGATLDHGTVSSISFSTVRKAYELFAFGFLDVGPTSISFDIAGLHQGNLAADVGGSVEAGTFVLGTPTVVPSHPMGAVPEPETWALMIGGLGAVGAAMRVARRRGAANAAA